MICHVCNSELKRESKDVWYCDQPHTIFGSFLKWIGLWERYLSQNRKGEVMKYRNEKYRKAKHALKDKPAVIKDKIAKIFGIAVIVVISICYLILAIMFLWRLL